jgi:hypothetical protein
MSSKPTLYKNEEQDLELHVSICHERYLQLDARLGRLEEDFKNLSEEILQGNKSLKATIMTSSVTIIVALIGLIATILTK